MGSAPNRRFTLFSPGSLFEARRVGDILRKETIGGVLLLAAAIVALIWANSPWSAGYASLQTGEFGPGTLKLHLTAEEWAADGLLAIFFFVAGLELKREFVTGDLRDPRRAALPIAAAVGGMLMPAVLYTAINAGGEGTLKGWATPTATDIAFALAVLAVISTHLPAALRTFLLTLAVVDDLLAIVIIAVFYTEKLAVLWLLAALLPLSAFTFLVRRRVRSWWLLLPLAVTCWSLINASGVNATVAGVVLGFAVPVKTGMAEHFEHRFRPISSGFAVPVFAFFSAGVTVGGLSGLSDALSDRVTIGVLVGLVVGKAVGVFGATFLVSRFTRADLDENLTWTDVLGLAVLAGVGFTVALLIGGLAFASDPERHAHVKVGVLAGSLAAAALAAVVLGARNRTYRALSGELSEQ